MVGWRKAADHHGGDRPDQVPGHSRGSARQESVRQSGDDAAQWEGSSDDAAGDTAPPAASAKRNPNAVADPMSIEELAISKRDPLSARLADASGIEII